MPKLFVATPTTGGRVHSGYCQSLARLLLFTSRNGVGVEYRNYEATILPEQRDALAAEFMAEPSFTHLLFIDSDMVFRPDTALRLLAHNVPFVGAICTRRTLNFDALKREIEAGQPFDAALALAHEWAFQLPPDRMTRISGKLMDLQGLGMGFTLISRECFERVRDQCGLEPYKERREKNQRTLLPYFRPTLDAPEDYAFCYRVTAAGMKVLGDISTSVLHRGELDFGMPFAAALRRYQEMAPQASPSG